MTADVAPARDSKPVFFCPNQFTHYEGELRGNFSQRLLAEKNMDFKEPSAITEVINNNFPGVKRQR